MKVTDVELHPAGSSLVHVLSFRDPRRENPYNVSAIAGLDADNIFPKYYGASANSGDSFYNMTLPDRSIVVSIQLNPDFAEGKSYSDLRDDLYRSISSSRTGLIELQFKNLETVVAVISGWVTKFEADLFSPNPAIKMTLKTVYPMLQAPNPVAFDLTGMTSALITLNDPLSTAPHGFDLVMTFVAATAYQRIKHPTDTSWSFTMTPLGGGFHIGDVLHLSSDFKTKELYYVRGGVTTHIADTVTPGSVWPILFPGENKFTLEWPGASNWTTVTHRPTYWGV